MALKNLGSTCGTSVVSHSVTQQHSSSRSQLIFYDFSLNQLFEDEQMTWDEAESEHVFDKNSEESKFNLKKLLVDSSTSGSSVPTRISEMKTEKKFCIKKVYSKYEALNTMTKAIKNKYSQRIIQYDFRKSIPHVIDIITRYMELGFKTHCEKCKKIVTYDTTQRCLVYPILNQGYKFWHMCCWPY